MMIGMTEYLPIYKFLFDIFIFKVDEDKRSEIVECVSEYLYRDVNIADREINITACFMMLMKILDRKIKFNE